MSKKEFINLPLRNGVGIVLLNNKNKVFVAKRIDNPKNYWQMPQGGVNLGEDYLKAALRELEEETSIKSVKLMGEINEHLTYNLPNNLLGIIWKGRFKGQRQKWFIFKFKGEENEINLKTKKPEFLEWKWINLESITETVVDFKLEVYKKIKEEVKKLLINF